MLSFALSLAFVMTSRNLEPIQVPAGEVVQVESQDWESLDFMEVEELQLGRDSKLLLPPYKSIWIRSLVAEDGARIEIEKSASGADGGRAVDGGNGQDVVFFIDHIVGHVVIESRGGNGGDGRAGRDGRQGARGENGRDGRTLFFGLFYLEDGDDGRPGYPGEDGEDGEDGGDGGDGGDVRVYYRSKTPESNILVDVSGGEAGLGGEAGRGGLGGNGGSGGRGIKRGKQGPMGRPGENGEPGRPGQPGDPGSVSIYQVGKRIYRCLVEQELVGDRELSECLR